MKNIEQRLKRIEGLVNVDKYNFGKDEDQIKLLQVITEQELIELTEIKDDYQLHQRFLQLRKKYEKEIEAYILKPEIIEFFEAEAKKILKEKAA